MMNKLKTGRLITFEGYEGGGKSTFSNVLFNKLTELGYDVIHTREPGGTPLGEELRRIILNESMCIDAELLLFGVIRAQHMNELILPNLKLGKIIISDRFSDSTYAYQGYGRCNGDVSKVLEIERFVLNGFEPDYTLYFDISLEESKKRLALRGSKLDVFEREKEQFRISVYNGYKERYISNPHRMYRIDANMDIHNVEEQVLNWINTVFIPNNVLESCSEEERDITKCTKTSE